MLAIAWNPRTAAGDLARAPDGRLASGSPIEAAVLCSLFTDRRAPADTPLPDGSDDRRGWWCDALREQPLGSRLWLLRRRRRDAETLRLAEDYAREALAWLTADGIAARVEVAARWEGAERLRLDITVHRADGARSIVTADWAWSS